MIKGIGTDIVKIARIEKAMQREGFLERAFTKREREERERKKVESYAAAFAAKEALVKARGEGFRRLGLLDVEVLHEENGKPYLLVEGKRDAGLHLSLSHEKDYAIAMVVWEA